jgi:hypothetical protein
MKEHIQGKAVFTYYKNGNLYYLTESGLLFPVPIADTNEATFMAVDKGIFFMRWIRKHLEMLEKAKNE